MSARWQAHTCSVEIVDDCEGNEYTVRRYMARCLLYIVRVAVFILAEKLYLCVSLLVKFITLSFSKHNRH